MRNSADTARCRRCRLSEGALYFFLRLAAFFFGAAFLFLATALFFFGAAFFFGADLRAGRFFAPEAFLVAGLRAAAFFFFGAAFFFVAFFFLVATGCLRTLSLPRGLGTDAQYVAGNRPLAQ